MKARHIYIALLLAFALVLSGCVSFSSPPKRTTEACKIFKEKPRWYKHTRRAAKKWRTDGAVMLAIMKQESSFRAKAKPKRKRVFGIPLKRPSSAYGYAQAVDSTWKAYKRSTSQWVARRDNFADAMDFIGWYVAQSRTRLKINPRDAYRNYLAYHEGWGGYQRRTYNKKKWLKGVAKRVSQQAARYRAQLARCGYSL